MTPPRRMRPRPRAGETGTALLEAVIGLGLAALIAGAGFAAFTQSARVAERAGARLAALDLAERALEEGAQPLILAEALAAGVAERRFEGRGGATALLRATPFDATPNAGPVALLRLTATAGPANAPALVTLETLRSFTP